MKEYLHLVLTHQDKNKDLVLNSKLVNRIKELGAENFVIFINGYPDKYNLPCEYIFLSPNTYNNIGKVRNAMFYYAIGNCKYFTCIDGDDCIKGNYIEVLHNHRPEKLLHFNATWHENNNSWPIQGDINHRYSIYWSIRVTNWSYLYNSEWISKNNIRYIELNNKYPEDELLFYKLQDALGDDPIDYITTELLDYYKTDKGLSGGQDSDFNKILDYIFTYKIKLRCLF